MSCVIPFPVPARRGGRACVAPLVSLHDAVAASRRRHRRLVTAAGRWALARGRSLPADHVALWAAAAEQTGRHGDVDAVTGRWLAVEMPWFVWSTVGDWCLAAGCRPPAELTESLALLYSFLADSGRLHPASDPLPEIRAALSIAAEFDGLRLLPPTPPPGPAAA